MKHRCIFGLFIVLIPLLIVSCGKSASNVNEPIIEELQYLSAEYGVSDFGCGNFDVIDQIEDRNPTNAPGLNGWVIGYWDAVGVIQGGRVGQLFPPYGALIGAVAGAALLSGAEIYQEMSNGGIEIPIMPDEDHDESVLPLITPYDLDEELNLLDYGVENGQVHNRIFRELYAENGLCFSSFEEMQDAILYKVEQLMNISIPYQLRLSLCDQCGQRFHLEDGIRRDCVSLYLANAVSIDNDLLKNYTEDYLRTILYSDVHETEKYEILDFIIVLYYSKRLWNID